MILWPILQPETEREAMILEETSKRTISEHIRLAHSTFKGEHQISEYVARLELGECARILADAPEGLPQLAARRDECRVGAGEQRSFEEVIRTWTEFVLLGVEGG